jgi:predicted GIY-YIG superfamily endonuclease
MCLDFYILSSFVKGAIRTNITKYLRTRYKCHKSDVVMDFIGQLYDLESVVDVQF